MSIGHIHTAIEQANIHQMMFANLPIAVALVGESGNIAYANKEFSKLTGYKVSQDSAQTIDELFPNNSNDHPFETLTKLHVRSGKDVSVVDNRCMSTGQQEQPVVLLVNKLSQLFCVTVRDAHSYDTENSNESKETSPRATINKDFKIQLERKLRSLKESNENLERSNKDLSQYAYVASHDLQEPLRKIRIYGDMLDSSDKIPTKEKFLLTKINKASERMSVLITDLLNYARLLKSDTDHEQVDLKEIIQNVISDFEVVIQEKKAVIRVGNIPVLKAVRLQMNQLFFNLLGNALKFTTIGEAPRIEIDAALVSGKEVAAQLPEAVNEQEYMHITVRDHGIGFKSSQAEEIFEVFKRLYTKDSYQGSGIGLALCRRIVQNHDGALYATSKVGEGSVFNIVLPFRG
ncbi:MAG: PAS domain-containing protein [Sphingobacteriales bacterium]|nr:MAG: PAS domain-containing protein [Sphingobacteriales bacterium]